MLLTVRFPFPSLARFTASIALITPIFCPSAEAANPSVERISPIVATRGSTFTLVVKGAELEKVQNALFYEAGIECVNAEGKNGDEVQLNLRVADQCKLGPHSFRVQGEGGFSELRTITISPFPTVNEATDKKMQNIVGNTTVLGELEADDIDRFQIQAKAGERISAEVVAVRLGANLLDTTLSVLDPNGKLLKRVDDTPLLNQDPALSIVAPIDGLYTVEVTSVGSNADAGSQYALHIGNFPRPFRYHPIGARGESETEIAFSTEDSESSLSESFTNTLRFHSDCSQISYVELNLGGTPCPSLLPFRVNSFRQIRLPSDSKANEVPLAVHGVIRTLKQIDTFSFLVPSVDSSTSIELCAEVFASRLGSQLDSVIEIADSSGIVVASGDDFDSHDSRVVFRAYAGKMYSCSIRDKRHNFGAAYGYQVEISPVQPSLTTFLPRRNKLSQAGQTISIPRSNRSLALIGVKRDRTDGPVSIQMPNLPNGVSLDCPECGDGQFVVPAVLTASQASSPNGVACDVSGLLRNKDIELKGGFQQIVDLVGGPADALFQPASVNRLSVAVVPSIPFSIELTPPTVPIAKDGTLEVKLTVEREDGFSDPIDISFPLLPEWVDGPAKARIPADQDSIAVKLTAHSRAKPVRWPLVAEGKAGLPERSTTTSMEEGSRRTKRSSVLSQVSVCTSLFPLEVAESPAHGSISPVLSETGTETVVEFRLTTNDVAAEGLVATLEGLPNRVHADPVPMKKKDTSVRFRLVIEKDAPIGTFESVYCRISGNIGEQNVSYCVARDSKLIIAAPGTGEKDETGRPLSSLESLRRRTQPK